MAILVKLHPKLVSVGWFESLQVADSECRFSWCGSYLEIMYWTRLYEALLNLIMD